MRASNRYLIAGLAMLVFILAQARVTRTALAQTPVPGQIELGERLFADNCTVCHGSDGQGRVGVPLSKDWPSLRPDLLVKSTIENGVPGSPMPAWSQAKGGPLTQDEIDAIVAYILTWETGGPASIPPTATTFPRAVLTAVPNVEGDPNNGAVLFDKNCAVCHGPDGKGRIGANLTKDWAAIRPDLSIKTTISNGIAGSVMPAWSQTKGGPLAEAEINDLVAFLLALSENSVQAPAETPTPTPAPSGFFTGWGGVGVALVLFLLVVAVAIIVQARRK
jgi:cytochrome c oxidase cbb3-type subunit III